MEINAQKLVQKASRSILIDGKSTEKDWAKTNWYNIDQLWIGKPASKSDFMGRYKLLWDENYLYVLAEITDDTLVDTHTDGLVKYWDDDCLEVFIDEDRSKGIHTYSHQAFAYHIGLDGKVADYAPDQKAHYYTSHVKSKRITKDKKSVWEAAFKIYDSTYADSRTNKFILLTSGKKMGFAIAYCDNDFSIERENFYGSEKVEGEDKNKGYIDAGIFGELILK